MRRSNVAGPGGPQAEERAVGLHRALADRRRAWIVGELGTTRGGLAVEDFASRLDLHPNTVRWHLGVLEDAGLVVAHGVKRSRAGRPRRVYQLTADGVVAESADERLMVLVLAGIVAKCADGLATAEQAGFEWGRYLAQLPAPPAPLAAEEAITELAVVLDGLGFASEPTEDGVRLRYSRFDGLIVRYPAVVEALLRGVVAGVLAEMSSALELSVLSLPSGGAEGVVALRAAPSADAAAS